ncbi:hypothetical protein QL285_094492 [Trifolium repens]|nr:hypothetical protein QL285_094492 [Trifolium repens]
MDQLEQENQALREEVTSMKGEMERLTAMMTDIMAAQAQAQASIPQLTNTSLVQPTSTVLTSTPQFTMPEGYPWGMPLHVFSEVFRPVVSGIQASFAQQAVPVPPPGLSVPQATMTYSAPLVHTNLQDQGPVFHTESVEAFDRVDDLQDKYNEMQREMRALCGKELFGQNAHELCLVPNVVIPHKFKVPDFEKYKGSTCPRVHLVMYARKMSTQTDNDKLLIYYFQDSLTSAALRWYMDLDSADIHTFNDLASAFIRQYSYNSYLAPDRDELRALTQKENESFKEYAQRWRELAAQIRPPLEEKELCKLFLNTLSPFYYKKMVASAPNNFTEMVGMGIRLEEGVREGRLTEGTGPASSLKKFGNNFLRKKESEVGMVTHGKPQSGYPVYPHIAAVSPIPQNPPYQPQMTQRPPSHYPPLYQQTYPQQPYPQQPQIRPSTPQQPFNQPNRTQRTQSFDPIPMKYADLLPALLAKNLVQTKPPPPVPERLPAWYRTDLTCAFHQGAPGHDVEHCYALKREVQNLLRANLLSFRDSNPNVQANPLPNHEPSVHMIQGCQEANIVLRVRDIKTPLVPIHVKMCEIDLFSHDHAICEVCSMNPQGCLQVQNDIQGLMNRRELVVTRKDENVCVIIPEFNIPERIEVTFNSEKSVVAPLVIRLPGPLPYTSQKAVPYKYDATMLQGGKETPIPPLTSVDNIADSSKVLRSGRILPTIVQEETSTPVTEKMQVQDPSKNKIVGQCWVIFLFT